MSKSYYRSKPAAMVVTVVDGAVKSIERKQ